MFRLAWHKFFYLTVVILALGLIGAGLAQDDDDDDVPDGCPRGQGYWANHPDAWVDITITIGTTIYTQDDLQEMLPGGGGDATQILLVQLVAAKLNIANGTASPVAEALVTQAEALLADLENDDVFDVQPSSATGQVLIALAGTLDDFNSGILIVGCPVIEETPEATPEVTATATPEGTAEATAEATVEATAEATVEATAEATVEATAEATLETTPEVTPEVTMEPDDDGDIIIIIEGPVQSININIITIYNINIQMRADDPLLTVIRIGDIIRVEGEIPGGDDDDGGDIILIGSSITIIAITVIIVDVDVVIVDGVIWRDYGDCGNPPPPWAPANGWRRRCETPQNNGGGNQGGGNNGGGNNGGGNNGGGNGMGMGDSGSGS